MAKLTIEGGRNDIRVLCTGLTDSADAGLVEGVPIDPPDSSPGWRLVELWIEHDTVQEKGDKGTVITRKVNPAYHQLWVRPIKPMKAAKGAKPPKQPKVPKPPRKPRERKAKDSTADDKQQTLPKTDGEQTEAPGTN